MRKLAVALLIAVVVAGGFSSVAYAHHKEDHGDSVAVGAKPGHSNPDENGNGPERDGGPADPAGEMAPHANNGCGNDTDRTDDNEGWCGDKPKITPPPASTPLPASTPEPTSTPEPPPSDTLEPTNTPETLPPADTPDTPDTPETPVSQPPIDVPEHTPPGMQEDWENVRVNVCLPTPQQPQQPQVITVFIRLPAHANVASEAGNYDLVAMVGGLMVVGYVAKRRTS